VTPGSSWTTARSSPSRRRPWSLCGVLLGRGCGARCHKKTMRCTCYRSSITLVDLGMSVGVLENVRSPPPTPARAPPWLLQWRAPFTLRCHHRLQNLPLRRSTAARSSCSTGSAGTATRHWHVHKEPMGGKYLGLKQIAQSP
jgi:hypothetical protein